MIGKSTFAAVFLLSKAGRLILFLSNLNARKPVPNSFDQAIYNDIFLAFQAVDHDGTKLIRFLCQCPERSYPLKAR